MKENLILKNAIRCKKCGDVIVSKSRHDFKFCKCGACAVDGGHDYLRRVGDPDFWEDASIIEEVVVEPIWDEVFHECRDLKPYVFDNGYKCSCFGYIDYEGNIYPVYFDDYGCQNFIVYRYYDENNQIKEYTFPVENMAGLLDWGYELDRVKSEFPNEIISKLDDFK